MATDDFEALVRDWQSGSDVAFWKVYEILWEKLSSRVLYALKSIGYPGAEEMMANAYWHALAELDSMVVRGEKLWSKPSGERKRVKNKYGRVIFKDVFTSTLLPGATPHEFTERKSLTFSPLFEGDDIKDVSQLAAELCNPQRCLSHHICSHYLDLEFRNNLERLLCDPLSEELKQSVVEALNRVLIGARLSDRVPFLSRPFLRDFDRKIRKRRDLLESIYSDWLRSTITWFGEKPFKDIFRSLWFRRCLDHRPTGEQYINEDSFVPLDSPTTSQDILLDARRPDESVLEAYDIIKIAEALEQVAVQLHRKGKKRLAKVAHSITLYIKWKTAEANNHSEMAVAGSWLLNKQMRLRQMDTTISQMTHQFKEAEKRLLGSPQRADSLLSDMGFPLADLRNQSLELTKAKADGLHLYTAETEAQVDSHAQSLAALCLVLLKRMQETEQPLNAALNKISTLLKDVQSQFASSDFLDQGLGPLKLAQEEFRALFYHLRKNMTAPVRLLREQLDGLLLEKLLSGSGVSGIDFYKQELWLFVEMIEELSPEALYKYKKETFGSLRKFSTVPDSLKQSVALLWLSDLNDWIRDCISALTRLESELLRLMLVYLKWKIAKATFAHRGRDYDWVATVRLEVLLASHNYIIPAHPYPDFADFQQFVSRYAPNFIGTEGMLRDLRFAIRRLSPCPIRLLSLIDYLLTNEIRIDRNSNAIDRGNRA